MEDEVLIHAGDFKLEKLTITSLTTEQTADITEFILELNLFEDLFSPCMTGSLILADAANLISNLPIIGNEYITFKLRTPTLEDTPANVIEKTFQIYAIYDRVLNDDRAQFYNISFMSIEGYEQQTTTITKSYNDTTDKVAQQIYEDYLEVDKPMVVLDTPHTRKIKYTSNHWSPFKNLNYICKKAKGSKLLGGDYLFFESNKAFYFASIESLIYSQRKNGVFDEYVLEKDGAKMGRRISPLKYTGNILPPEITRIENLKMLTTLDIMDGNNHGAFASSVSGYDLYTKKVIHNEFNYREDMNKFTKTGPVNMLPENLKINPLSKKDHYSFNTGLYNDFGLTDEEDLPDGSTATQVSDRILFRKSYLNSFENYKFEMVVPGRTDIQVGSVISLLHPSPEAPSDDLSTVLDPLLSGLYIISAIKHTINSNKHTMKIELIKNGLSESPEKATLKDETDVS